MKYFFFIISFFLTVFSFAQQHVEGYVKDSDNDSIVPYCHVYIDSTSHGTIGDSNGYFEMEIPDSLSHFDLIVKTLGYENYVGQVSELTGTSNVIYLHKKSSDLPSFEVSDRREKKLKTKSAGSKKKKNNGFYFSDFGDETALFFDNENGRKGYISKVKFFITNQGFPDTPFRVRIYEADKKSDGPGKEILDKNITASAVTGDEWVTIDLLKHGIKIPKAGFFVAMEWLPVSKERAYETKHSSTAGGQCLGGTHEFGVVSLTWYKVFPRNTWTQSPVYPNTYRQLNAKIAAELMVYKQRYADLEEEEINEMEILKVR